jgi:hypothetical protein
MAVSTSMVMRSMEAKKNAAIGMISVALAKKNNDVLYHKLIKYRKLWVQTKKDIQRKYGSKALQIWAQKQAKG